MTIRLAALTSHPIQYQAPLFQKLADQDEIDLTVYFCSRRGYVESHDPGFGHDVEWDVPLLEGYHYEFLEQIAPLSSTEGFLTVNPGIHDAIKQGEYDAIWVHGYGELTNWLAFVVANINNMPLVLRGEATRPVSPTVTERVKQKILDRLFDHVTAFGYIGSRNRRFYEWHGIPTERLFHAPYSVNNDFFQRQAEELPKSPEIRNGLDLPKDRPLVLFVGKFIKRKRPRLLLEAFAQATDPGEATLTFVGDGELRSDLKQQTDALNRQSDVHFAGFINQSELPKYYSAADVFVLPSIYENWGLVVNEAMNFGLPIITTDAVGCSDDLIEKNGIVVKSDDKKALADNLEYLLSEENDRREMGKKSKEKITNWGIPETASGILQAVRFSIEEYSEN